MAMRRSVATVSMSGTLRQKLEAIAAARFDGIELFENDFVNFNGSAGELRSMAADLGLGIDLYQPFRDFEGMPDAQFKKSLVRAERKFDVMEALGAPLMLVCSNTSTLALDDPARAAAQLHELAERAARRGLRIGYEALAWGRFVRLYGQAWSIVERAEHPHLGLILDSFHTLSLKDDPSGIAKLPGERIFFLQMADAPLLSMDVLQWARHHRNFPGQGQFDLADFFVQVLLSGYAGPLSLEIFNDQFRETPNRRTAVDAMRSLLFLESEARTRLEQARAGAQAAAARDAAAHALGRVALFDPPAAPPLEGIAFIEFGAIDDEARALAVLFGQLGFAHVGNHRTKQVRLFRQGAIQLVINAEPGSPARARFEAQGHSVGAIGLATPDPAAAASRAGALLSARHDSRLGAGQLVLPAIVAPGGTVVHFVPSIDGHRLDADFAAVPGADRHLRPGDDRPRRVRSRAGSVRHLDPVQPCGARPRARREPRARRSVRSGPHERSRECGAQRPAGAQRVAEPAHPHRAARSARPARRAAASTTSRSQPGTSSRRCGACAIAACASFRSRRTTTTTCATGSTSTRSGFARCRRSTSSTTARPPATTTTRTASRSPTASSSRSSSATPTTATALSTRPHAWLRRNKARPAQSDERLAHLRVIADPSMAERSGAKTEPLASARPCIGDGHCPIREVTRRGDKRPSAPVPETTRRVDAG
jgi:sugar phosphate isomerase/epimerase